MFHISRSSAIIKASIFGAIIALVATISVLLVNRIGRVDAITPEGATINVTDPEGQTIYYDDDNHTQHYHVDTGSGSVEAFCAQPSLGSPLGGSTTALQLSGTSDVDQKMKLVIFLYQNNNAWTQAARNEVFSAWPANEYYAWTHAIIGVIYDNDYGDGQDGGTVHMTEINKARINNAIAVLGNLISSNSDAWIMAKNYQLYLAPGYEAGAQDIVWLENNYKYGGFEINKCDQNSNTCTPQGDANFAGITFEVYNNSGTRIYNQRKDTFYDDGALVDSEVTDANGYVAFSDLLANDINYRIVEKATNASYQLTASEQTSTLSTDGQIDHLNFYNLPVTGKIIVNKTDSVTGTCTTLGDATFDGTTFQLVNNSSNPIIYNGRSVASGGIIDSKSLSGGSCSVTFEGLPFGNYTVTETSASEGYDTNTTIKNVTIPTDNSSTVTVTYGNTAIVGEIVVNKVDSATGTCTTLGDATFDGTTFQLVNNSTNAIVYNGRTVPKGGVVDSKTLANGGCSVTFSGLPYGNYTVTETSASEGYNQNTKVENVTIPTNNSSTVNVTYSNTAILGKVVVNKTDSFSGTCVTSGDASFDGTTFQLINNSTNPIVYNGRTIAKGEAIDSKSLSGGGCNVTFEGLPYGNYTVKETSASYGYNANPAINSVTIPTNSSTTVSTSYSNTPITGKITVNKVDAETNSCTVRARAHTFEGITFQVINKSAHPVYYNGEAIAKDAVIMTKVFSDSDCNFAIEGLPYGTYHIKETATSTGYVLNTTPTVITIPTNASVNVSTTIANEPIRGDLKFVKKDSDNNNTMSNTLFSISAIDENFNILETHFVVSDANGVVNTSANAALHTFHTNGYDAMYDDIDTEYNSFPYLSYGSWFGFDTNGASLPVNDSLGALPYGKYLIQEMRCNANRFCYNLKDQKIVININKAHQVVDLGNWDNTCAVFSINTEATDPTDDDKYVEAKKDTKIVDHISYCARKDKTFTIKGILMDKATGEPVLVDGNPVESSIEVTPKEECEEVDMEFSFDGSLLGGKEVVVFEKLYYEDELITSHEDIDDANQTIEMGRIDTYAADSATGKKTLPLDQDVEIKDIVKYCLTPNLEYTVKGILMDKETGQPVLMNGQFVEAEATFTPETSCGEIEMFYKINTTDMAGKKLVMFESLYRDEELLIEHKDFNNADESVDVEIPAPNTGALTNSAESGSSASGAFIAVFGVVAVSFGGYLGARYFARRKVMKF